MVVGTFCFLPALATEARYVAMIGWFIASGVGLALVMAALPLAAHWQTGWAATASGIRARRR